MTGELIDITCPACGQQVECWLPNDESIFRWTTSTSYQLHCPHCTWDFECDDQGRVIDDRELDAEPPFTLTDEGELDNEDLQPVACPFCTRQFSTDPAEIARCPGCRRHFAVPVTAAPATDDWGHDEYEVDCELWDTRCPACNDEGDCDGPEFEPLHRGWVQCGACGWIFASDALWQERRSWLTEEHAAKPRLDRATVAVDGSGDFKSLSKAACAVGDRGELRVRPGDYDSAVGVSGITDGTLRLVGDGPPESIRLTKTVHVLGGRLYLEGITLERPMEVIQGQATLRRCSLGAAQAALRVWGGRSRVNLRDCVIRRSGHVGLVAVAGARVTLRDCQAVENAAAGIEVQEGAWVRLRRCQVARNGGAGIVAHAGHAVFLRHCQIADNGGDGLVLRQGRALVRDSQISGSGGAGIRAGGGCLALFRSDIHGSAGDALRLGQRTRTAVSHCRFANNTGAGIVAAARTRLALHQLAVTGNTTGMRLASSARLGWRGSACTGNRVDWDLRPGAVLLLTPDPRADVR